MLLSVVLLVISIAVILFAAELFTNGVEWLGKKLNLGEGAVGSILAAVGTALPETILPMVAILLGGTSESHEIGIGAILGAPFMLSTAAFLVTGSAIFIFAAQGRRTLEMRVNPVILERDMRFFLIVYAFAVASSFIPSHAVKIGVAALLVGLYGYYVWRTLNEEGTMGEAELAPLRFAPGSHDPATVLVVGQLVAALGLIIAGAKVFVGELETVAHAVGIPSLVLALILAPLATELPEKFNSVLWVRNWKDTLAMGNITGAMVFQSCIPVAVGLVLTEWVLDTPGLISAIIALGSGSMVWALLRIRKQLSPHVLMLGGIMYLVFIGYVIIGLAGSGAAPAGGH
jgi:cation:H+ antiporter